MSKYILHPFNEFDPDKLEQEYEVEIEHDGRKIAVDLNFDEGSIKKERLSIVEKFITGLIKYDQKALAAIAKDFRTGGAVKDYVEYHKQELNDEALTILLKNSDKDLSTEQQMAAILHLNRVGFYPDNTDKFAVFDYTIDKNLTDYLIVVEFTERGKIELIAMES